MVVSGLFDISISHSIIGLGTLPKCIPKSSNINDDTGVGMLITGAQLLGGSIRNSPVKVLGLRPWMRNSQVTAPVTFGWHNCQ